MKYKRIKVDPKKQIGAKSNTTLFIFVSFAAIFSVVVLGYIKLSEHGSDEQVGVEKDRVVAQNVVPTPPLTERLQKKVLEALPAEGKGMVNPVAGQLRGRWFANVAPDGIAEFTFTSKGYELIYVSSPQSVFRQFSVGTYTYDPSTGYLGLFPDKNAELARPQKGAKYKAMTSRNFQMVVLKKSGEAGIFMTAHERDLAGKNYHPIFLVGAYDKVPVLEFMPVSAVKK